MRHARIRTGKDLHGKENRGKMVEFVSFTFNIAKGPMGRASRRTRDRREQRGSGVKVTLVPCGCCGSPMPVIPMPSHANVPQFHACQACLWADLATVLRDRPETFKHLPTVRLMRGERVHHG